MEWKNPPPPKMLTDEFSPLKIEGLIADHVAEGMSSVCDVNVVGNKLKYAAMRNGKRRKVF